MKNLLLTTALSLTCMGIASAQETIATLFTGSQDVTWENTKSFESSEFKDAKVGDYLYVTYADGDGGIEFKANGTWLPGSNFINTFNNSQAKCYLTEDGLAALQQYGLELCGTFHLETVSLMNDGFVMPEGAVWGGYYWIDNGWNTLEIFKTAFAEYDGQQYLDIYLSDNNDRTDYELKVLTNWEPETDIATNDQITHTTTMATVDLSDINLSEWLEDVNALMIQGHVPNGGTSFNITAVVLRDDNSEGEGPGEEKPGDNPDPTPNPNPSIENLVSTLYNGEPANVTWETPLNLEASLLNDVEVGDYIYITFSNTSDVIELKADGVWVPGTKFTWLGEGTPDYKYYVTADGLATMKEFGLQITGAGFTVTGVYICNDGFVMPEGAVWGGYFWIDSNWNTLELFKTAFNNYGGQRYLDIYLSDDNNDNTDYELKVLTNWDPETLVASNDKIEHTPNVATVDLQNVNLPAMLADVNALMIQGHTEVQPFNITAVVLRDGQSDDGTSIISVLNSSDSVNVYNLQGQLVKSNVAKAELVNLPKGVYILKGENGTQKVVR